MESNAEAPCAFSYQRQCSMACMQLMYIYEPEPLHISYASLLSLKALSLV